LGKRRFYGGPLVPFLIGALIALRWDAIGGIALLAVGLATVIIVPIVLHGSNVILTTKIMLAGPPLISGIIFLAARRKAGDAPLFFRC
jgi:hypothetical protein